MFFTLDSHLSDIAHFRMTQIEQNPKPSSTQTGDFRFQYCLLLIAVFALLIRLYGLTDQSLTNDEVVDLEIIEQSWSEVTFEADGFPPGHHLLAKLVYQFTESDLTPRYLAVIYGTLSVVATGLMTYWIADRRTALIAAGLLSIAPMHVYYSQEGRAYALFFLLASLAGWLYWRAMSIGSFASWGIFALFASVGCYVHYYFGFILIALGLGWLIQLHTGRHLRTGLVTFTLVGLLQIPVLGILRADVACQSSMRQGTFDVTEILYTGWTLLSGFCIGPSTSELHYLRLGEVFPELLPWIPLALIPIGLAVLPIFSHSHRRVTVYLLFLIPLGLAWVLAATVSISQFNVRYVFPCLLPLTILISLGIRQLQNRAAAVIATLAIVAMSLTSVANRHLTPRYFNEDSKSACQHIEDRTVVPTKVYTISHYMEHVVRHYLPEDFEVLPISDISPDDHTAEQAMCDIDRYSGEYWVFYSRGFHGDEKGDFRNLLLGTSHLEHYQQWAGVELFHSTGVAQSAEVVLATADDSKGSP